MELCNECNILIFYPNTISSTTQNIQINCLHRNCVIFGSSFVVLYQVYFLFNTYLPKYSITNFILSFNLSLYWSRRECHRQNHYIFTRNDSLFLRGNCNKNWLDFKYRVDINSSLFWLAQWWILILR